uniref:Anaphase-promoting complex subunit 10 n=1 Tax=Panagrolaimus sp. PS1159 TaxID=55785 RepID=A0AC35G9X3_9BILA
MDPIMRNEKSNEASKKWQALISGGEFRDITFEACWTLSSCKAEGYGISQLLNPRIENYWQSDGGQPHRITLEFQKKTEICFVLFYLDFRMDESYTPSKIVIHHGSSILDLGNPIIENFHEPSGWVRVDLRKNVNDQLKPIRTFVIQISILQNHQNGRDTHIRGIRVIGPSGTAEVNPVRAILGSSTTSEMRMAKTMSKIEMGGLQIR